ncbi:hypothetical protein [Maribacter sp. ACAM166]|uniref:hypothetical protein n=1 Tax=Maribacter sp. ACAM166 TaxID=2508996 RepID=UPI0010FE3FCD|nr:hypothetical protein [Maribacter sp. ACAM166]TLP79689.1 hypothetical protein ES765_10635 [Maribacter sp. ACAM166]
MSNLKTSPSIWFLIIAILALLWNLVGVMAFISELLLDPSQLEVLSETNRNFYETRSFWGSIAYALAVFAGTLGAIALLIRKRITEFFFILSLIGILGQQFYIFFLSDAVLDLGLVDLLLPIAVIIIGFLLMWYAKYSISNGWLK